MQPLLSWQQVADILAETDSHGRSKPCSLVFVTANEAKQTGGEVIRFDRAERLSRGDTQTPRAPEQGIAPVRADRSARSNSERTKPTWMYRIRDLRSNQIRFVHLHLILFINDQPVR